jgi:hypothetical protein
MSDPSPKLPGVGRTVIAKWWPGKFYLVSTICMDGSSLEQRLIKSLQTKIPLNEVGPQPDKFLTQVFKCNKYGMVKSFDNPLLECEYTTIEAAKEGHQKAVEKFT